MTPWYWSPSRTPGTNTGAIGTNGLCSSGTCGERSDVVARSSGIETMCGGGGSAVRRLWVDNVLDGAFALGVLAGLGYAAAVIAYALVTRWIGG